MFVYINQTVNVRWRDKLSERFRMTNAVRQGAVSSAILYDNFLLSPNIDALQEMIKTCESFAKEHNLQFSTDPDPVKCKTKLIAFSKSSNFKPNANVYYEGTSPS